MTPSEKAELSALRRMAEVVRKIVKPLNRDEVAYWAKQFPGSTGPMWAESAARKRDLMDCLAKADAARSLQKET